MKNDRMKWLAAVSICFSFAAAAWIIYTPTVEAEAGQHPQLAQDDQYTQTGQVGGTSSLSPDPQESGFLTRSQSGQLSTTGRSIGFSGTTIAPSYAQDAVGGMVSSYPLEQGLYGGTGSFGFMTSAEQELISQTNSIVTKLRESTDDDESEQLSADLRKVIEEHFDVRMTHREEQLQELEERLEKLRADLNKRKSAKDEIIELRHQSLVNEANGLGF